MFIAMNRFHVKKGSEKNFEQVWLSRDTHLTTVPGGRPHRRRRARGPTGLPRPASHLPPYYTNAHKH